MIDPNTRRWFTSTMMFARLDRRYQALSIVHDHFTKDWYVASENHQQRISAETWLMLNSEDLNMVEQGLTRLQALIDELFKRDRP